MKKTLFSALAVFITMASCTTETKRNYNLQSSILGQWEILQANGICTEGADNKPFILFTDSGYVNGNASVNNFFGQYTINADSLKFDQLGVTSMMGGSMEIESAIMSALNNCATLEMEDSILNIKDNEQKIVMTLKRN